MYSAAHPHIKFAQQEQPAPALSIPAGMSRYALTEKGANLLRESVRPDDASYWAVGQTDIFESLPRGIILAWLFFGVDEAHRGAVRAAEQLLIMAGRRQREAEELHASLLRLQPEILKDGPTPAKGVMIATAYQWIKDEYDATLFRLEGEAIERLHQLLAELPPVPLFGERDGVL